MLNASPYAEPESGTPSWRTGEREAAIVFLSLALYIILDVNVSIYRVFRKKRGLYYWSLIFATWGTAVVAVGNILKNLKSEWGVIWPLWTLLINGGWSVYAPAELLILYSRLHLVNQNDRLHRQLLIMIVVGSTLIIIPNWVFIFPAYDTDPAISSEWSPRMAIIDRVSQAGFTVFEVIISSIYIHSLRDILRTKVNTRTRRVMRDLILVNVTVISMDIIVITLIFLNQANLAYPLQDLAYAFKFKIEFAVLNQLMAVAASGSRYGSKQSTWEEKRYRQPGHATILKGYSDDDLTGVRLPFLSSSLDSKPSPHSTITANEETSKGMDVTDHANITKPPTTLTKDYLGKDCNPPTSVDNPNLDQSFAFSPGPDLAFSHLPDLEDKNSNDRPLAPIADDGNGLTLANEQRPPSQLSRNHGSLRRGFLRRSAGAHFHMMKPNSLTQISDPYYGNDRARIAPFDSPSQERILLSKNRSTHGAKAHSTPFSYQKRDTDRNGQKRRKASEKDDDDHDLHAWERRGPGNLGLEASWFHEQEENDQNDTAR